MRLKNCDVTMLAGEPGVKAGTQEQLSDHVSFGYLCADEREKLLFVFLIV